MSLVAKEIVPWLRFGHGLYNSTIIILFFYQARLGVVIRRARKAKAPLPLPTVRRHRKMGPVLSILGVTGFFIGLTVVTLGDRRYLDNWRHLVTGLAIATLLVTTYALSRRIKGPDSPYRNPHLAIGIAILVLYVFEALLGIGILF